MIVFYRAHLWVIIEIGRVLSDSRYLSRGFLTSWRLLLQDKNGSVVGCSSERFTLRLLALDCRYCGQWRSKKGRGVRRRWSSVDNKGFLLLRGCRGEDVQHAPPPPRFLGGSQRSSFWWRRGSHRIGDGLGQQKLYTRRWLFTYNNDTCRSCTIRVKQNFKPNTRGQ